MTIKQKQTAIKFAEWCVSLNAPKRDMDTTRRFTPQVKNMHDHSQTWIDTERFCMHNPKFYSTSDLFELFLKEQPCNSAE